MWDDVANLSLVPDRLNYELKLILGQTTDVLAVTPRWTFREWQAIAPVLNMQVTLSGFMQIKAQAVDEWSQVSTCLEYEFTIIQDSF